MAWCQLDIHRMGMHAWHMSDCGENVRSAEMQLSFAW